MKKKVRFIINPRSGTQQKTMLPELIRRELPAGQFETEILYTSHAGHAIELSRAAREAGVDVVAIAGGDGSVNEAASSLIGSTTTLAVLPFGSGNGLARHLGIPLHPAEAIRLIAKSDTVKIDTFKAGPHIAIGTFGIGFDAHVAHLFAKSKTRGYTTYAKLVLREFSRYPGIHIELEIDGDPVADNAFLLTFANSSQFGNNAVIAPYADIRDGWLDISIVHPFPFFAAPGLIYRLTKNSLHRSRYFRQLKGKEILVRNNGVINGHVDGEPVCLAGDFKVSIVPESLNIIVPSAT